MIFPVSKKSFQIMAQANARGIARADD